MRAYILDWNGTLTRLGNRTKENDWTDLDGIKAFLDALHARGDVTILYSGGLLPKNPKVSDWFTFFPGTSKDLDRILEALAVGDKAEKWPAYGCEYPADRFQTPDGEDFDPTPITEICISDDQMCDADDMWLNFIARKMGRPARTVRFIPPSDLAKEVTP